MRGIWKSSIGGVLTVVLWASTRSTGRASSGGREGAGRGPARPGRGLLGVELDDELLLDRRRDLTTVRLAEHLRRQGVVVGLEPGRDLRGELGRVADELRGAGALAGLEGDDVAVADLVARDVHPAAVEGPVAVADELARLAPRGGEAEANEDVVEAALEQRQEVLARDALLAGGAVVVAGELLLEHAVVALGLLLLAQLDAVLGLLLT